jgi:CBS domain-containing protein
MSETIGEFLKVKGYDVYTVQPDSTIAETLRLMSEKRIGFVPVLEDDRIIGVFSERDFARLLVARDDVSLNTPIRSVMVSPVYFIKSDQTIDEAMSVMNAMHFRHLPVLDDERLIAVVSIGDIIKRALLNKDFTIEQLEEILWANLV